MIVGQVIRQVNLDTQVYFRNYWIFDKASVLVNCTKDNQIIVYKLKSDNTYQHFRIYNPIWGNKSWLMAKFHLSKKKQKLFCIAILANKSLLFFVLDIHNQSVEKILQAQFTAKFRFARYQFQSKFYQLISGNLRIINYKQFPQIDIQTKLTNVQDFELINFSNVQLMKVISENQTCYYKLPLTTLIKVRYHGQQRNTFFLSFLRKTTPLLPNIIIDKIKSRFYGHHERVGDYQMQSSKDACLYDNAINIQLDQDKNLKCFQTIPKQKIIRKFSGVSSYRLFKLDRSRYIILSKFVDGEVFYICDVIKGTMFNFVQSCTLQVQDEWILETRNMSLFIHQFRVQENSVKKIPRLRLDLPK